jgi:hypothetical protein
MDPTLGIKLPERTIFLSVDNSLQLAHRHLYLLLIGSSITQNEAVPRRSL